MLLVSIAASCSATAGASVAPTADALPVLSSPVVAAPSVDGRPPVTGPLRATGGPFLRDAHGRVVLLHGVNVVYKHPPYEVYPDRGRPWNFSAADASLMGRLGFNVVRLGMTWKGLEPGTAPANDPKICRTGAPGDPHQYNRATLDRYLGRLKKTVDLLARFHIFTVLDMHQDVYNAMFDGEGAPNWAVCTSGEPNVDPPGRWSRNYANGAADVAFDHFWDNDVVGNLQGQFDMVWGQVARYFAHDPWVIGFDPFNEPFSTQLVRSGTRHYDAPLDCFYAGRTAMRTRVAGAPKLSCPRHSPAIGIVPTLQANDRRALIFVEPDNNGVHGHPTFLAPMNFRNLVFNFHVYCGARSPVTGNPTDLPQCLFQEARSLDRHVAARTELATTRQRAGPAMFMSEFGATSDASLVSSVTGEADLHLVGWTYWTWRYYSDPTGSAAESLVMAGGRLRSTALALSGVYPVAVAGTPLSMSYDPSTNRFELTYRADRSIHAPTVIDVPTQIHYAGGYCAVARGARVVSRAASPLLRLRNTGARLVFVVVDPGSCPKR
jgi:endoglycosylceramidase